LNEKHSKIISHALDRNQQQDALSYGLCSRKLWHH